MLYHILFFILGILLVLILLLTRGLEHRRKIVCEEHNEEGEIESQTETLDWFNLVLAKLNQSGFDGEFASIACNVLSRKLRESPDLPPQLLGATVSLMQSPTNPPYFTNIRSDESGISALVDYNGSPSFKIEATTGISAVGIQNLLRISVAVELTLKHIITRITLHPIEENQLQVCLGEDAIVEVEVKPLLQMQQSKVDSISGWLSNFILQQIRGREFTITL